MEEQGVKSTLWKGMPLIAYWTCWDISLSKLLVSYNLCKLYFFLLWFEYVNLCTVNNTINPETDHVFHTHNYYIRKNKEKSEENSKKQARNQFNYNHEDWREKLLKWTALAPNPPTHVRKPPKIKNEKNNKNQITVE